MSSEPSDDGEDDDARVEAEHRRVETVFVVGAGVSRNSWPPVCRALKKHFARLGRPVDVRTEIANLAFAQHVHLRRFYAMESHPSLEGDPVKQQRFTAGGP